MIRKLIVAVILCISLVTCASATTYFDGNTTSVLYLNGTSNSTTITDEMGSIIQWTSTGIANISTATKLFGSGSLFNSNSAGTAGYIKTSNSTFANFGTGDFTIEMSIYPTGIRTSAYSMIMCEPTGTDNPAFMLFDNTGGGVSGRLNFYDGTTRGGSTQLNFSRWWNVSVVRQSGNLTLYVEGISNGSFSSPGSIDFGAAYIGHDSATTLNDFRGFIDNVRVSNTARYTGNYIPKNYEWGNAPTPPPYVPAVTSILLLNGTANSTTITDEMGSVMPWGSTGIANISTATKLFGSGSLFNSNTTGAVGYIKTSNVSFANFEQGNFTIEMSIYPLSVFTSGYSAIMCEPTGSEKPLFALYDNTGSGTSGRLQLVTGTSTYNGTVQLTPNRWWNVSAVRDNGNLTLYVEGISNGSFTSLEYVDFGAAYIGHDSSDSRFDFRGFIDNVRISNYAQYTSNYVPANYEWGIGPLGADSSRVSLNPYPNDITTSASANMTLDISNFIGAKAIIVNLTYNKTALNITNVYLNSSSLPGNTLAATLYPTSGFAIVNVSNATGITPIGNTSIADVQFEALSAANTTEPVNYDSADYISNASVITSIAYKNPGLFSIISIRANFTASNLSGAAPLFVQFNDTSTGNKVDAWNWSFGDGNISILQNPNNTYVSAGNYTVNLTVTNATQSSTKLQNITVFNSSPIADFIASNMSGTAPLFVVFNDTSTGAGITNWYWDFGDIGAGNTSTLQNTTHTFVDNGTYTVNLTVVNDGGSSTKFKNITVAMFGAYFVANQTVGAIPFPVLFTDTSIGNYDSWNWSVDDGTLNWFNKTVYADRNLEYTFNSVGSWRVNLSVQNISESGPIYSTTMNITATNVPPVASFIGYPSAGTTSTSFIFNDTSTGIITSRNWSFGDGNYSSTQNVTHVFPSNGIYDINLTVSNDGGSSFVVHQFTVSSFAVTTYISPTSGVIPLLVTFNETYSGLIPDSYYWEFGDGSTSTSKNTTHTYTTIGTFNVNHRVINDSTVIWSNTTGAVTTLGGSVTANFTANITSGDYPLPVQFTDTSTYINATPSSWYWTFGDGFTSTLQNPSHVYSNVGTYSVNFTTNTDYGSSSLLRSGYINVGGVAANGRQDVILINSHNITIYVKDASSGNLISYATVTDELGGELTSYGNGVFTGYYSTGQHTFTANATNYYTNRATYLVNSNLIQTIYLTQVATSISTTWYTPKTIQISFTDVYGNQLRGASVSAHYNETTLPNGVSDLISNYGMNANVANEALNGTLIMAGSTDYQGSIVFTMLSTVKYDVTVTYGSQTNYYSIYPQDSQYQFKFLTTVATDNIWDDLYANGNTKVWATDPDPGNVTFWWSFQDMTNLTTRIDFYLKDVDLNTTVYMTNVTTPISGSIYQLNYTVPNVRGKNYIAYVNYTRDV